MKKIHASKPYKRIHFWLISSFIVFALTAHAENAVDLFSQIQALQSHHNLQIKGLEHVQNREKVLTSGGLDQQIQQLFAAYNYVVSRDNKGRIDRIVIVNLKQKKQDNRIVLPTRHQGSHFTVSVSLSGDGRLWQTLEMVIDTGADLVVLPESMINALGLNEENLSTGTMQTANGTVEAKIGLLQAVKIAGESVENVEVAFIADPLLGENKLLGMSLLGRYQVNIDDEAKLITLIRK